MAMRNRFAGYSRQGRTWLREIVGHNDRTWFAAQRATFEDHVRAPTFALVEDLNARLARFAPSWVVDPKRSVQRIYRDLRFAQDKRPYKTWMAARFGRIDVPREAFAGLRIAISADGAEILGGTYQVAGPHLRRLRDAIAADHRRLHALATRRALRAAMGDLDGALLQRVPRAFASDHPAADYLRRRQMYFRTVLPKGLLGSPALVREIARRFKLIAPFVQWIESAIDLPGAPAARRARDVSAS